MTTTTVPPILVDSLPASKITGQVSDAQIAAVAASKVTGQMTDAQIAALAATKLTGTVDAARLPTGIDTQKLTTGYLIARCNSAPGVANETWVSVVFNLEEGDAETCYDQGTGVFTCEKAGLYQIHASVEAGNFPTVGKTAMIAIYKNSTQVAIGKMTGAVNPCSVAASVLAWLDVGNTVSVKVWHNEGSTKYLSSASEVNYLCVARLAGG